MRRLYGAPEVSKGGLFSPHYARVCAEIHSLLQQLPEFRSPREVPFDNGLYFWFETGEFCSHLQNVPRIVRVGNHPHAQDGLKNRLRNHYSGTKNGSVFRKFIGGALLRSRDEASSCLAPGPGLGHWERQDLKPCKECAPVEKEVSRILRERFFFKCVRIDDKALRNHLERVIIRNLSECPNCRASETWLGRLAYNSDVRKSGMWNSEFTFGPLAADDHYLVGFASLVSSTLQLHGAVGL
jgi:hypothetical protein